MEKIKLFFSVFGAFLGVTGAYAASRFHHLENREGAPYNWYIYNGQLAFTATINVARSACPPGGVVFCLRGTATIFLLPPVTLLKPI